MPLPLPVPDYVSRCTTVRNRSSASLYFSSRLVSVVQKYTIGDLKNRKGLGTRVAFTAKAGACLFAPHLHACLLVFFIFSSTHTRLHGGTISIEYVRTCGLYALRYECFKFLWTTNRVPAALSLWIYIHLPPCTNR